MGNATNPHAPGLASRLQARAGQGVAFVVFVAALVLVLLAWSSAREREIEGGRRDFAAHAHEVSELLRQRLVQYELVNRGGVSVFRSIERPTAYQWQNYVEGMQLEQRFPALVGLGFAGYVPAPDLPRVQMQWRDAGYGLLQVRPHGRRPTYAPILYLEPRRPENVAAIGFDMMSEPARREAMLAALRTGLPRLTGPVRLVQDGNLDRVGLLLYLPVYGVDELPATPDARLAAAQGWIYAPIRMQEYVTVSSGAQLGRLGLRIDDVTDATPRMLFSGGRIVAEPAFVERRELMAYGRRWQLTLSSGPLREAVPELTPLRWLLVLGLLVALSVYGVAFSLARTGARAREIAVRLTEEFRRSELRFRSAMEYSAIGKVLLDSQGRIVDANPAFARIVGQPEPQIIGRLLETLFDADQDAGQHPAEANGVWRGMRRLQRSDGSVRHVHVTYAPVPGNIDQDVTGLAQVEDVTERMLAEARVHALNRTLEARVAMRTRELMRANQELETFAYSVSHDLRAPLRSIDGFARILSERYGPAMDDAGRGYLDRVRRAAGRMGELIDAMLQLSRLTRSALKVEEVDLSRMAREVADDLHAADPARVAEFEIAPDLVVQGDATLLRNLLANLLGNAWKFTQEREAAHIAFGRSATGEFFVRDNGAGFSQEYVGKLFRPFQRLHTESQFAGHGIGLATVQRIVERHGGTVRAEGREGAGATIYFTLPGPAAET